MKTIKRISLTGFTLIEMLVVTTITVVLLVVGADLFGGILRSSNCPTQLNEINQNGKFTLDLIERKIRGATEVWAYQGGTYVAASDPGFMSPWSCGASCRFAVTNSEGTQFTKFEFILESGVVNGKIVMAEGNDLGTIDSTNQDLTNINTRSGVSLVDDRTGEPQSPRVTINYTPGKPPIVGVSFVLASGVSSDRSNCDVRGPFNTSIELRSY